MYKTQLLKKLYRCNPYEVNCNEIRIININNLADLK